MLMNMWICVAFLFSNEDKEWETLEMIELWMSTEVSCLHDFGKHGQDAQCFKFSFSDSFIINCVRSLMHEWYNYKCKMV